MLNRMHQKKELEEGPCSWWAAQTGCGDVKQAVWERSLERPFAVAVAVGEIGMRLHVVTCLSRLLVAVAPVEADNLR